MDNQKQTPIAVGADEGQGLSVMGGTYRILAGGKDTGSEFATIDMLIPAGGGFKNRSAKTAHLLCTVVPAGLEEMFLEMGQPVPLGQFMPPPTMDAETQAKMKEIAEKYGQKLYPPDFLG
jgi:hypothetical protein